MDTVLSSMLAKAFIVPISNEDVENIKQIIDGFLEEINVDKLQLCGAVYFERIKLEEFRSALDKQAEALDLEHLADLSDLAYIALSEYVLYQMACSTSVLEKFRFLTSLYIRNFLVLQKNGQKMFYPQGLMKPLKYADEYLNIKGIVSNDGENVFKPNIFLAKSWEEVIGEGNSFTLNHLKEIKTYAMKAEKYDFLQEVASVKNMSFKDSFQKAFVAAYRLSQVSSWLLVDSTPKLTVQKIMTNSKTSKKLQCIDLDLTAYPYVDIKSNSSLLLGYIYDSEKSNRDLDQMEFSPMEFAIYLYYEFLLEKLMKEYGN